MAMSGWAKDRALPGDRLDMAAYVFMISANGIHVSSIRIVHRLKV
jgi:hypothetical protein